jgi:hypothetical protein
MYVSHIEVQQLGFIAEGILCCTVSVFIWEMVTIDNSTEEKEHRSMDRYHYHNRKDGKPK